MWAEVLLEFITSSIVVAKTPMLLFIALKS